MESRRKSIVTPVVGVYWIFIQYPGQMLFRVVPLCISGVRLSKDAIRGIEPILGRLKIEDWVHGHLESRAVRVARLGHPTQSYFPELLFPLFDPVLTKCDIRGMLLSGFECNSKGGGEVARVLQVWWLREPVEVSKS